MPPSLNPEPIEAPTPEPTTWAESLAFAIARRGLSYLTGIVLAHGWMTDSEAQTVAGGVLALLSGILFVVHDRLVKKTVNVAIASRSRDELVSKLAGL